MKESGLIFSGPMVRAILENRKTQTRRLLRKQPGPAYAIGMRLNPERFLHLCPYGTIGDRLWVRETFYVDTVPTGPLPAVEGAELLADTYYRADGECCDQIPECQCADVGKPRWRSSIHMPRWASRISLEITDVRVEPLQDITEADVFAEGIQIPVGSTTADFARAEFAHGWDGINSKRSPWASQPWIWALSFRRLAP